MLLGTNELTFGCLCGLFKGLIIIWFGLILNNVKDMYAECGVVEGR